MNQEKYIRVLEETISKLQEENHELKRKLKSRGRKEKLNTRTKAYMRLDRKGLVDFMRNDSGFKVEKMWITEDVKPERVDEKWLNVLVIKR